MNIPNVERSERIDNPIRDVLDSYDNGQFKQMRDQIKTYGTRKFFLDLYPYVIGIAGAIRARELGEWYGGYETYTGISDTFYRNLA